MTVHETVVAPIGKKSPEDGSDWSVGAGGCDPCHDHGRTPNTGGSLTLLPWAIGLLAAGLLLLGSAGVNRRNGTVAQRTVR